MSRIKAAQGECSIRNVFDQADNTVSQDVRFIRQEYRDKFAPVLQQIRQRKQQQVTEHEVVQQKWWRQQER